ncbi:MAG: gamma-glutamylcyclotransferase [Chlorobiales bacterium]|nr:gamma-glutamylcyclotransferase [Chlorobiales bacterium]
MKHHLVFVYGTLMKGYGNHRLMENATFLGYAETLEKYRMTYTSYPMLTEEPLVQIKGELYEVSEEDLLGPLDELEGVPHLYERKEIQVKTTENILTAWVYIYKCGLGRYSAPTGNYRDVVPALYEV